MAQVSPMYPLIMGSQHSKCAVYFDSGAWRIPRTFQETAGWWITLNPEWLLFISPLLAIVDMRPAYDICYKMTWLRYKTALLGANISLLKTLSSRWFSFSQDGICSFVEGIYYRRFTVVTPETYTSFRKTSSWHIWEQADWPSDKLISTWFTLKSVINQHIAKHPKKSTPQPFWWQKTGRV